MALEIEFESHRYDEPVKKTYEEFDRIEFSDSVEDGKTRVSIHKEPEETEDDTHWLHSIKGDLKLTSSKE